MVKQSIAQEFRSTYRAPRRVDTGHKSDSASVASGSSLDAFGRKERHTRKDAFAGQRKSVTARRLAEWERLQDASKAKGGFDYAFLLGNNLDLYHIEYSPTKTDTPRWFAYVQFVDFRLLLTLWQEDVDILNTILGWKVGEADYTPACVLHWIQARRYDRKWGLIGISALWRDNDFLFQDDIECEMQEAAQDNIVPVAVRFVKQPSKPRRRVAISPFSDKQGLTATQGTIRDILRKAHS